MYALCLSLINTPKTMSPQISLPLVANFIELYAPTYDPQTDYLTEQQGKIIEPSHKCDKNFQGPKSVTTHHQSYLSWEMMKPLPNYEENIIVTVPTNQQFYFIHQEIAEQCIYDVPYIPFHNQSPQQWMSLLVSWTSSMSSNCTLY